MGKYFLANRGIDSWNGIKEKVAQASSVGNFTNVYCFTNIWKKKHCDEHSSAALNIFIRTHLDNEIELDNHFEI